MRNRSSLQQLLVFYGDIFKSLSASHSQTDVIFLDIAKAFDSVPHNELLLKLRRLGVCGDVWLWLKAYLFGRLQCVSIDNNISSLLPVLSGVPQGSILGPLLFIVYINDLPLLVHSAQVSLFADDTKCKQLIRNVRDCISLQDDLNSMGRWSTTWKLLFKEVKCALLRMCLGDPVFLHNYTINGGTITCKDTYKDLGVVVSSNLSWSAHHNLIVTRAYKALGLLRRTFTSALSIVDKKMLYLSLVRSQLMYCSPVWRPHLI